MADYPALPQLLTLVQLAEARALCDDACERLETHDEYVLELTWDENSPSGAAVDMAMRTLRAVGLHANRDGSTVRVRAR